MSEITDATEDTIRQIEALVTKATQAGPGDALHYTQAASNAANALCAIQTARVSAASVPQSTKP